MKPSFPILTAHLADTRSSYAGKECRPLAAARLVGGTLTPPPVASPGTQQPALPCQLGLMPTPSSCFPLEDSEACAASSKRVVFPIPWSTQTGHPYKDETLASNYHFLLDV